MACYDMPPFENCLRYYSDLLSLGIVFYFPMLINARFGYLTAGFIDRETKNRTVEETKATKVVLEASAEGG